MTYIIVVCTVKKTPDDGQRNCPKHVEFYSKNKFEKLLHLVGFIIGTEIKCLGNVCCLLQVSVNIFKFSLCYEYFILS